MEFKALRNELEIDGRIINPNDIDLSLGLCSTFGKSEVEQSAVNIIKFFQTKGIWCAFTMTELFDFYKKADLDVNKMLFGLLCPWEDDGLIFAYTGSDCIKTPQCYFVAGCDYKYMVTDIFIKKCLSDKNRHLKKVDLMV